MATQAQIDYLLERVMTGHFFADRDLASEVIAALGFEVRGETGRRRWLPPYADTWSGVPDVLYDYNAALRMWQLVDTQRLYVVQATHYAKDDFGCEVAIHGAKLTLLARRQRDDNIAAGLMCCALQLVGKRLGGEVV